MFVVDASVVASWAFPDENEPAAQAAFRLLASETAAAPTLFWFELRNVLLVGERRGRITPVKSAQFLKFVAELPIRIDHEPDESVVMALARAHKLTVYDTAYLELAVRKSMRLATQDSALAKAARTEDAALIG
jgi:predicted nucleic acid-binding protein